MAKIIENNYKEPVIEHPFANLIGKKFKCNHCYSTFELEAEDLSEVSQRDNNYSYESNVWRWDKEMYFPCPCCKEEARLTKVTDFPDARGYYHIVLNEYKGG